MIKILITFFIGLVIGLSGCPQQEEVTTEEEEYTIEKEKKENAEKGVEHPGDLLQDLIN